MLQLFIGLCLFRNVYAQVDAQAFSRSSFDYLVVGGGSAGLALASRLSDNPDLHIGVIEAGLHKSDNNILVPGLIGSTLGDPNYDWLFFSEPQPLLDNRTIELGRGKVLGGTSALNFMAHTRASVPEYDGWGSLGNPNWTFETVQNYIKKSERWTPPQLIPQNIFHANDDPADHGTGGSVNTTSYTFYTDIVVPFFDAFNSLGIPTNNAAQDGHTLGVWTITGAVDAHNRSRSYSTTAYYEPRSNRSNLVVLTGARATRVIFANEKDAQSLLKATSVEYIGSDNKTYQIEAGQEVILSCGAIQSPQLLELSGIGDPDRLRSFNITPLVDLPGVGENLQDHPGIRTTFRALDNLTTLDELDDPAFAASEFELYDKNRTGMYSSTTSTIALLRLQDFLAADKVAEIKAAVDADLNLTRTDLVLQRQYLDNDEVPQFEIILFPQLSSSTLQPVPGEKYYTLNILLQHSWARGSVHIGSADPTAAPKIDPRYLTGPGAFDSTIFFEGLKFAQRLATIGPLGDVTLEVLEPSLNSTREQLIQYISEGVSTNYHFIGSAAMLPRSQNGVVDSTLKVYGTNNLRVVDASVFPVHAAAHPTAVLYGLAERVVDIITRGETESVSP